ncbi:acetate--CoA ligase family protein [Pseudorhodoferax soli]|uniref:Acyl-CoA synthetase (NDP forming) n=1 Tax=Pseudorhodoferax soli TaxID=545864 RepID=A0A368XN73_9BURK|nr:acetate--CoA ligase family protein [Pseudorhodoferax soli]RCW67474.1 acyl-CoA synthetase (NDP forming) [Pseudorhodoferax soli]
MNPTDTSPRAQVIARLLHPRSIAVVGASADLAKINGRPLKHLIDKGFGGRILPVNPKYREIAGLACFADIASLPDGVDMAVVAVPAREVVASVEALGARGVPAAVVFSSGFGEMGEAGRALEQRLADTARRAGVLLCGPNCLGFINAFENVYATFSQYADGETGPGPIAFVTQSGAFGTAIAALVRQRGLGLGYFINTGNEADLQFAELMLAVVEDPRIRVAAGYLEGLTDGDGLVRLAQRCRELGKPLVLTKVGRMASGARAAASHTGALAVEDAVFDAVIRQHGVLRARNEEQMLDMLEALAQPRVCEGFGLGIATQSGGAGVMMADRAEEVGLAVPELSAATQQRLAAVMPAFGAAGNPVDVTGQFVARPELLRESVVTLLDDPQVHMGIVWLQLMTAHVDKLVGIFEEIQARTTKPFFVCWVAAPAAALQRLRALGIVVYGAGERAVEAAAALARHHAGRRRPPQALERSAPAAAPAGAADHQGMLPSVQAAAWLQAAGVPMAPVVLAHDADAAVAAWRYFGAPVALKVESPDIAHKTEVGGVLLRLDDEAAVRAGVATLRANAARHAPQARIDGVLVQPMAAGHVELVVGVQRDPVFGMVVMVGSGGVLVEVLKDVAFRRAPFGVDEGLAMLAELRMGAVLDGVRGQPAVDRRAIAQLLADLSRWAAATPRLAELDLNPVRIGADGPVAVDCVMVLRDPPA